MQQTGWSTKHLNARYQTSFSKSSVYIGTCKQLKTFRYDFFTEMNHFKTELIQWPDFR